MGGVGLSRHISQKVPYAPPAVGSTIVLLREVLTSYVFVFSVTTNMETTVNVMYETPDQAQQ